MYDRKSPHNNETLDVHAVDVAEYILRQMNRALDTMKLQKLCYYAQAWSLAWGRGRMFPEPIEAWEQGPVVRSLFRQHKGRYSVDRVEGDADIVASDPVRVATIADILAFYGNRTGRELSDLTHIEDPWALTRARGNRSSGDHGRDVIPELLMERYYRGLMEQARAREQELHLARV
jgi:uncharacterized phage-associated protein